MSYGYKPRTFRPLTIEYPPTPGVLDLDTGTAVNTQNSMAWSPDGKFLAVGGSVTPYIRVYRVESGRIVKEIASPGTLPAGVVLTMEWSPDGAHIAVGHQTSPYLSVYAWTSAGFGSRLADPATLPAGNVADLAWHPLGTYIVTAHAVSPYVTAYPFSGGAIGTKITNPVSLPIGEGYSIAWATSGSLYDVIVGVSASPYIHAYPFTTGWGSKSDGGPAAAGVSSLVVVNRGTVARVLAMSSTTPYVQSYARTVGTSFSGPTAPPTTPGGVASAVFDPVNFVALYGESATSSMRFAYYGQPLNAALLSQSGGLPAPVYSAYIPTAMALSPDRRYLAIGQARANGLRIVSWDVEDNG